MLWDWEQNIQNNIYIILTHNKWHIKNKTQNSYSKANTTNQQGASTTNILAEFRKQKNRKTKAKI